MLGAIVGDIAGSRFEFSGIKSMNFPLLAHGSGYTDDSVITLAVAKWLVEDLGHTPEYLVQCMQEVGRRHPASGYGSMFFRWLFSDEPQPYNSWGNGAGMRVSPVGMCAGTLQEALSLARISAEVSHNHPEGIKGAEAIAASVFLARTSGDVWAASTKAAIRDLVSSNFGYDLNRTIEEIRPAYSFDESCQGSVPEAIIAYLDGRNFEEAIRLAISLGGDSDTIACMTGAIAGANGDIPEEWAKQCRDMLPPDLLDILDRFEEKTSR